MLADDLHEHLRWALGFIEYQGEPSPLDDPREGRADAESYRRALEALDSATTRGAVEPSVVDRLANDLAGAWRERAEKAEREVTVWKTRLVEETERLRALLNKNRRLP